MLLQQGRHLLQEISLQRNFISQTQIAAKLNSSGAGMNVGIQQTAIVEYAIVYGGV